MFISSRSKRWHFGWLIATALGLALCWSMPSVGQSPAQQADDQAAGQQSMAQPSTHLIQAQNERMDMIVNTSRVVTLSEPIPKLAVNNPDVLSVTPLSPTEVQVSAKKTGVTQINLWSESGKIYTLDVMVIGDARELAMMLRSKFPNASLDVTPLPSAVIISGNVDDATQVNQIVQIAEQYYPAVINQIVVGGVQQVLLQVRVMEVSRSKLRTLGVDFGDLMRNGGFVASGPSGLLKMAQVPISVTPVTSAVSTGAESLSFGVIGSGNEFFSFLNALRTDGLARVLAEPNLVTVSGRPAYFNVGGQIPVPIPQSLGTISIQYKPYGTQVDFVPIVLGNGAIRLEVRPSISEIDNSLSVPINGTNVPALVVREIDTGVEMRPGQTLAIAGLVQNRVESTKTGIPWISDMPYIGALFRKNTEQINEVELLILVTPQLIEAMDPHEVPPCGPGMNTNSPTDCEFYLKGYLEVPNLCNPGAAAWPAGASQVSITPTGPGPAVVPDAGIGPGAMAPPPSYVPPPVYAPPPGFAPPSAPILVPTPKPSPAAASPPARISAPKPVVSAPSKSATPPALPPVQADPMATAEPATDPPRASAATEEPMSAGPMDAAPAANSDAAVASPPAGVVVEPESRPADAPPPPVIPPAPASPTPAVSLPPASTQQDSSPQPPQGRPNPAAASPPILDNSSLWRLRPPTQSRVRSAIPAAPVVRPATGPAINQPATTISYDQMNPDNRYQRQTPSASGAAKSPPTPGFIGPLGYDVVQ